MQESVFRFTFGQGVSWEDIQATLLLALWGSESLHGESLVALTAPHHLDETQRTCTIDATTLVGATVHRLFRGYLAREFGENSFQVERVPALAESEVCA
jgi:hypothetical protein